MNTLKFNGAFAELEVLRSKLIKLNRELKGVMDETFVLEKNLEELKSSSEDTPVTPTKKPVTTKDPEIRYLKGGLTVDDLLEIAEFMAK